MATRRRYPDELREQAVRLALGGRPLPQLATELGVPTATLRGWVRADQAEQAVQAAASAEVVRPVRVRDHVPLDPSQLTPGSTVHVSDLEDAGAKPPHLYELELTFWGDTLGDDVHRSNHRSLLRDYSDHLLEVRDTLGNEGLAFLPSPATKQRLAGVLRSLVDYPLYDDRDQAALVNELVDEAWDGHLCWEVEHKLEQQHGIDCYDAGSEPARHVSAQRLRELFDQARRRHGDEFADNAVTVVFPSLDEMVADIAATLRQELAGPLSLGHAADSGEPPSPHHGIAFLRGPGGSARDTGQVPSPPHQDPPPLGRVPGR